MFLCRGGRCIGSVASTFRYNFEITAEVGVNLRQHATWALCDKLRRVQDRCINNNYVACRATKTVDTYFAKGSGYTHLTTGQITLVQTVRMFALKAGSVPSLLFTIYPRMSKYRICLYMSGHCFCGSTEIRYLQDNASRALSTATKQRQVTWTKGESASDFNKEQPTKRPQGEKEELDPEKKPSKTAQLQKVFKEYGAVGVSFHIGISLISLGIFYIALSSGINMAAVLCKMGFSESVVQSKMAAGTSTFVLAYAVHKLFAPLRISITLVSVPFLVRYLRKTGLFKPPPPSL